MKKLPLLLTVILAPLVSPVHGYGYEGEEWDRHERYERREHFERFERSGVALYRSGSTLSTEEDLLKGKTKPRTTFRLKDTIGYEIWVSWENVRRPGGEHQVTWNWYHHDKLVSTSARRLVFQSGPYRLWSTRPAMDLGPGKFEVEVVVDGRVFSSQKFEIK